MQLLLKTQTEEADLEDDDPQVSYMISAWARMCKILGKDFTQYLPLVMPPLLKTANMKPEVAIFDSEDNKTDMSEVDGWEFVTLGDQQVCEVKRRYRPSRRVGPALRGRRRRKKRGKKSISSP